MRQRIVLLLSLLLTGAMLVAAADGPTGRPAAGAGRPTDPACAREAEGERDWGTVGAGDAGADGSLPTTPGADDIVDFWIDRWSGADLAVTDGRTIQTSHDAGCTFDTSFRLDEDLDPDSDVQPATSHIVAIEAADRPGTDRLVAVIADLDSTTVVTARLRTLVSDDRGDSWRLAGRTLPPVELARGDRRCGAQSLLCQLAVSAVDPDRAYLVIPAIQGAQLWMSDDGGETFQQTYDGAAGLTISDAGPQPALEDVALDPFRPDMLWAADVGGLAVSADAGRTWTALGGPADGLSERIQLEVAPLGDEVAVAVVTAGTNAPTRLVRSLDTGRSFSEVPMTDLDGQVTAMAAGNSARDLFLADEAGAAQLDVTTALVTRLGGATLLPMRHPHAIHRAGVTWFATDFGLAVRGDIGFLPPVAPAGDGVNLLPFDPVTPRGQLPGQLLSERNAVQLDPGESVEVPLELVVPPAPTPVDIFFLFDESGSMKDEVDALAVGVRDVVNTLRLRGLNPSVGVGGYANSYRYRRYREIGPADGEFLDKLERLTRNGSSEEYAFTALHQVATGSGLPDTGQALAPRKGEDARWRPGAVRIVIHFGDEQLKPASGDPDQAEATQALVDERIYHLALVSEAEARIQTEGAVREGVPVTQQPWREITRATGALAGPSGVDCNGDGVSEIPEGGEIICFIPEVAAAQSVDDAVDLLPDMASVVVEVVSAVSEFHELSFHTDLPELVSLDTGRDGPLEYDIRKRVEVPLTATITCLDEFDGQVLHPKITAVAAARHLAATTIDVACGVPLPAVASPVVEGSLPAAVAIGPAPAGAPAPPAPANPATTGSQATSQAASQATAPSAQGAAGAVKEKSTQAQVAFLGRPSQGQDEELDLLMPATRRRSDPTGLTLGAGAVMAAGFGIALMRRERRRGVPSRQRI